MQHCKVCKADKEIRDYVDSELKNGNSANAISKELEARGVKQFSYASINRHKRHIMSDEEIKEYSTKKHNTKYDDTLDNQIDLEILNKLDFKSFNYKNVVEQRETIENLVNTLLVNQLGIVLDLQGKYIKGKGKYPADQIRGLQVLQSVTEKIIITNNELLKHRWLIMNKSFDKYFYELGKNEKLKLKPYVKGEIFRICLEHGTENAYQVYESLYMPISPVPRQVEDCLGSVTFTNEYKDFRKGFYSVTTEVEINDLELFEVIIDLDNADSIFKEISRLSKGEYDISNELAKHNR